MSVNNEDVLLRLRKAGIPIRVIRGAGRNDGVRVVPDARLLVKFLKLKSKL